MLDPGAILFVVILSPALAFFIAKALLRGYRDAVAQTMQQQGGVAPQPSGGRPDASAPIEALPRRLTGDPQALLKAVRRGRRRLARAHLAGGLAFAAVVAGSYLYGLGAGFPAAGFVYFSSIFAWPLVLTLTLLDQGKILAVGKPLLVYSAVFLAAYLATLLNGAHPGGIFLWLINLPVTLLPALFLTRGVRSVGALVLAITVTGTLGANALVGLVEGNERTAAGIGALLGWGAYAIAGFLILFGFGLFARSIGGPALQWTARLYDEKKLSDQSLAADSLWLFSGAVYGAFLMGLGTFWGLLGLVAFAVYKAVSSLLPPQAAQPAARPPQLLQLRTFAPGDRSERLHYSFSAQWRYIGSACMIGGPDLARTTLEPSGFLAYIAGRLAELFIESRAKLEQRVQQIDTAPDPDGRYRIQTLYCYDDTWQPAVQQLLARSDAVLMDLRGFTADNLGCRIEIQMLRDRMPLERVVFAVDSGTNTDDLRAILAEARARTAAGSPNAGQEAHEPRLVPLESETPREIAALLEAACAAAVGGVSLTPVRPSA